MKIAIVGSFDINKSYAYDLINHNINIDELVFIEESKENIKEILLNKGASFFESNISIKLGTYSSVSDASILIITGSQDKSAIEKIVNSASSNNFNGIYMLATDNVNVDCYYVYNISSVPTHKVIGIGTMKESACLSYIISDRLNLNKNLINAYVIGDSANYIIPWDICNIGVLGLEDCFQSDTFNSIKEELDKTFINNTYITAIALAFLTDVIINNKKQILTVSSYDAETGIYISMPSIVDRSGVRESISLDLNDNDINSMNSAIKYIKESIAASNN